MRATELAKAIHHIILERGDIDIAVINPFGEIGQGSSDWTGEFAVISQRFDNGDVVGMIVPRPSDLRIDPALMAETMVHSDTPLPQAN